MILGIVPRRRSASPRWASRRPRRCSGRAIAVVIGANLTFPSLMSLLSKRVGVDQQGQLQGALAILFGARAS